VPTASPFRRPSRRCPHGDLELHLRGDLAPARGGEEKAHGAAVFAEHSPEGVAALEAAGGGGDGGAADGAPGGGVLSGSTAAPNLNALAALNRGIRRAVLLRIDGAAAAPSCGGPVGATVEAQQEGAEEEVEPRCRRASAAADAGSSWSTRLRRPSRKILTVHARVARGRRGRHPMEARAGGGVAKWSGLAAHGGVREGERVREPGGKRERDSWFASSPGMGDGEGRLHFTARAAAAAGV
jgi:hypothetical protein